MRVSILFLPFHSISNLCYRPSLDTIKAHPFLAADPKSIPSTLPTCCTHVAPEWKYDEHGYLVAVASEEDEMKYYQDVKSTTMKNEKDDPAFSKEPMRESKQYPIQQLVRPSSRDTVPRSSHTSTRNFEIYTEPTLSNFKSDSKSLTNKEYTTSNEEEDTNTKNFQLRVNKVNEKETEKLIDKMALCSMKDDIVEDIAGAGATPDDTKALEIMYARLRDLLGQSDVATSCQTAHPIVTNESNIWVTRYVDYTSKYGLGFLFNDGRYVFPFVFLEE